VKNLGKRRSRRRKEPCGPRSTHRCWRSGELLAAENADRRKKDTYVVLRAPQAPPTAVAGLESDESEEDGPSGARNPFSLLGDN
jgi:hypothetical protein